jgi:Mor family transcriptional regulator
MQYNQNKVVNKGRGPQPEVKRNKKIAEDYKVGRPIYEMVAEYKMSPKRIYEILDKLGVPRNRRPEPAVPFTDLKQSE